MSNSISSSPLGALGGLSSKGWWKRVPGKFTPTSEIHMSRPGVEMEMDARNAMLQHNTPLRSYGNKAEEVGGSSEQEQQLESMYVHTVISICRYY